MRPTVLCITQSAEEPVLIPVEQIEHIAVAPDFMQKATSPLLSVVRLLSGRDFGARETVADLQKQLNIQAPAAIYYTPYVIGVKPRLLMVHQIEEIKESNRPQGSSNHRSSIMVKGGGELCVQESIEELERRINGRGNPITTPETL